MAQPTVNRFYKGLNSDMSLTDRSQDMYLDGHNIRLARREEGTLWAANIRGNEETFSLSDGFIPIGSKEFDGFLFILSVNPTTGISEIGSFPSPAITGGITRAYRPLQNYTTVNYVSQIGDDCLLPDITDLGNFTTPHLNFSCSKPARVEIRLDYDGSVNIYWTDDYNPWRVVNNGFVLSTGLPNNRYVTQDMVISGFINGINESDKHPIVDMLDVPQGGSLKVGNYFFFVRYVDLNFLSTSFLGQSGPVPVFFTTGLSASVPFGGEPDAVTDKAVDLFISNLDTSIGFIEIGYIRAYGNDLVEAFLIDKRYGINGNTFRQVKVTGNEPLIPLTIDELLAYKPSDALYCKDMAQEQNQLYLANTRGGALDHPDLRRFMCALAMSEGASVGGPADTTKNDTSTNPYSLDPNDTEEKVGYFSGESYIFACVPVFKGGFVGQPYPMSGVDNYNNLAANANKDGIYRFKRVHEQPYWDGTDTYIKNIRVGTTGAQAIYSNSQWLQDNLIGVYIARGERNKVLLYQGLSLRTYNGNMNPYLQTEKTQPNTSLNTYERNGNTVNIGNISFQNNPDDWHAVDSIPLFEPATYYMMATLDITPPVGANFRSRYFGYSRPFEWNKRNDFTDLQRLAVFSVDYYIDKVSVPDTAYVQLVGTTNYANDWERESTSNNTTPINQTSAIAGWRTSPTDTGPGFVFDATSDLFIPPANRGNAQTFVGYNQLGITYATGGFSSEAQDVVGWSGVPINGFTARYDEGKKGLTNGMYFYEETATVVGAKQWCISLPIATPDYIGLRTAPSYSPTFDSGTGTYDHFVDTWDRAIVNVCRSNPDFIDYLDLYDFKNTNFFAIGNFQPIADFLGTATHDYWRGDCIISRSYLKVYNGSVENIGGAFFDILSGVEGAGTLIYAGNNFDEAIEDFQRGYGHWVSIVTEQAYNSNYRHELGRNLFYPKTSVLAPGKDFAWLYDSPESYFFNKGYKNYLGARSWVGIDLLQPISNNRFPTRIRPSITHIFGAVRDGYRQFIPADAKDFDYSNGEIQAIATMFGALYSFQNRAINLHPLQERVTSQGSQGSTAILGASQGLTEYRQVIKEGYGSQHRFSVIKAGGALYCIDFNKRAILRVSGSGVENLDIVKGVQTWFRKIVSLYSTGYSDVLEQLPNEHPCSLGIHGAYNRKYKEVVWTLRLGVQDVTIVFSEEMDAFLGTHGYKPIHYGMLEEDLYAFNGKTAWLQDVSQKYQTFFGKLDEWRLRYVTNEGAEVTKHWDNIIISSNNRVFKLVKYETQHQTAEQNPFIPATEFWYAPTYRENEWRLPIRRADNVKEPELSIYDDFGVDKTPMRGRYLITELHYEQDKELWVREVITFNNQSFV